MRGYRIFRAVVTIVVLAVIAALLAAVAMDLAGRTNNGFNPFDIAESIPGFWPMLLFLVGLSGGMWLDIGLKAWAARRRRPRPIEILYDPNDHRFVHQEFRNGQLKATTCVAIAIHNTMGGEPLQDVVVSARKSPFVRAVVEPSWGGRIRHIDQVAPGSTELLALFALPEAAPSPKAEKVLRKVQRLVIRVRAGNVRGTKARFVFNARARPILRRVS